LIYTIKFLIYTEEVYGQKTLTSYTKIESTCFRKTPRHRVNKFVAGLLEEEVM